MTAAQDANATAILSEKGMEVVPVSPEQKAMFREAAQPAVREYIVVVFVGLIVAPVMSVSMRNRDVISLTWFALFSCLGALSLFSNCARFLNITALLMEFREVIKL